VTNLWAIILLNNLLNVFKRLIGLYEAESVGGLLGLGMGITVARFHVAGK
jgi:hypothetical protein